MTTPQGSDAEDRTKDVEAPSPTIVGPRPEGESGESISVPRGMEQLLTLAGLNEAGIERSCGPIHSRISLSLFSRQLI